MIKGHHICISNVPTFSQPKRPAHLLALLIRPPTSAPRTSISSKTLRQHQLHHPNNAPELFLSTLSKSLARVIVRDQTGKYLAPSLARNNYIFVLYEDDSNSIHGVAIKNCTAGEIKYAYSTMIDHLKSRGLLSQLQILDNEASKGLLDYINKEGIDDQFAPPNVHRCNAAERAISTYKDHLIACLSSTDKEYPLHLWDKLIPQGNISLNLLRCSCINPQLSAYAHPYGAFDFIKHPLPHPALMSWFTKNLLSDNHGIQELSMHGTLAQP
jgi:hypothetical protein